MTWSFNLRLGLYFSQYVNNLKNIWMSNTVEFMKLYKAIRDQRKGK